MSTYIENIDKAIHKEGGQVIHNIHILHIYHEDQVQHLILARRAKKVNKVDKVAINVENFVILCKKFLNAQIFKLPMPVYSPSEGSVFHAFHRVIESKQLSTKSGDNLYTYF